jgi:hypothetical protein
MPVLAEQTRVIGEFTDYNGLINAVRARVNELAINGERFDEYAGLPRGYLSKLIGVNPARSIGKTSLGPLCCALGIKCIIVEDEAATARLKSRLQPRNNSFSRTTCTSLIITDRKWRQIQKIGRQARWKRLTKTQRSEIMRMVRYGRR